MRLRNLAVVSMAGLLASVAGAKDKKPTVPLEMYVVTPSGTLVPIAGEEMQREQMPSPQLSTFEETPRIPRSATIVYRVPGARAAQRFREGEPIKIVASLPDTVRAQQFELLRFGSKGNVRKVAVETWNARTESHWNAFRVRLNKISDARWSFTPINLSAGEYCFVYAGSSPVPIPTASVHCFGVDAKR